MTTPISGDGSKASPFVIDIEARLDFEYDWTDWLTPLGDTIIDQLVEPSEPAGLDVQTSVISVDLMKVIGWVTVSTGTVKTTYRLPCKITTAAGRIDRRSLYITIVER